MTKISGQDDWNAYNEVQTNEVALFDFLLHDLVQGLDEPGYGGMGRPPLPLRDVVFCTIKKAYTGFSLRRNQGFIREAEGTFIRKTPNFNVASRFLNSEEAKDILRELIRATSMPLASIEQDFAVDSTAFRTTTLGSYSHHKHGVSQETTWLKLHAITGVTTSIIPDCVVTHGNANDSPFFGPLVSETAQTFSVREVSADKAYSSRANHDVVVAVGGEALIPFKVNASPLSRGSLAWKRAYHYFQLYQEEFLRRYHKRSAIESTFAALKKKFGESVRSKTERARHNEILAKVVAYNICVLLKFAPKVPLFP